MADQSFDLNPEPGDLPTTEYFVRYIFNEILKSNPDLLNSKLEITEKEIKISFYFQDKDVIVRGSDPKTVVEDGDPVQSPIFGGWLRALSAAALLGKSLQKGDCLNIDALTGQGTITSDNWLEVETTLAAFGISFSLVDMCQSPEKIYFQLGVNDTHLFAMQKQIEDLKSENIGKREEFFKRIFYLCPELSVLPRFETQTLFDKEWGARISEKLQSHEELSAIGSKVVTSMDHDWQKDCSHGELLKFNPDYPIATNTYAYGNDARLMFWDPVSKGILFVEIGLPTKSYGRETEKTLSNLADLIKANFDTKNREQLLAVLIVGDLEDCDCHEMIQICSPKRVSADPVANDLPIDANLVFLKLAATIEAKLLEAGIRNKINAYGGPKEKGVSITLLSATGGIIVEPSDLKISIWS